MLSFLSFLSEDLLLEATASGYSDEHALANLWNHAVNHPKASRLLSSASNLHDEINKAKKDPSHPLNFSRQTEGFTGGKKPSHKEAYYNELHHAADAVVGIAKHPTFKKAVIEKHQAKVAGSSVGKLSPTWRAAGAKNATSKSDVKIGKIGVSLKKGSAQLMSAESRELKATYDHATSEHMKSNPKFTVKHKKDVLDKITKIGKHMDAMKGADRDTQEHHRVKAQKLADEIQDQHPNLMDHVAHEAATGNGKFGGAGNEGTSRVLVTTLKDKEPKIHDTLTSKTPIKVKPRLRIALPKGRDKETGLGTRGGNGKIEQA